MYHLALFRNQKSNLQHIFNEIRHLPWHNFMGIMVCSSHQEQVKRLYFPVLTYTSKQADKARSSNHFRNKDKQFNPYYIIHWIQLISSKVTPESKIVLALHFIYSYEGITGNQDSLLRALLRTPVTRALYTWKHHLNHDQSFTINFFLIYEKKLFHSDFIITFTIFCCQVSKPESVALSNDFFFWF